MAHGKQIIYYFEFEKFPYWTLLIPVISGAFITLFWPLSLIGLIVSGYYLTRWFKRPNDAMYDAMKEECLEELEDEALDKLRVNRSELVAKTEMILSPTYWKIPTGTFLGVRRGKDGIIRYTPISVALIFFTEHKLCIYQCALDLSTGNPLPLSTDKYFYEDIVHSGTRSEPITLNKKDIDEKVFKSLPDLKNALSGEKLQINATEQFVLTTRGGTSVKIQMPDLAIIGSGMKGKLSRSRAEDATAAVEAMIDSKKSVTK